MHALISRNAHSATEAGVCSVEETPGCGGDDKQRRPLWLLGLGCCHLPSMSLCFGPQRFLLNSPPSLWLSGQLVVYIQSYRKSVLCRYWGRGLYMERSQGSQGLLWVSSTLIMCTFPFLSSSRTPGKLTPGCARPFSCLMDTLIHRTAPQIREPAAVTSDLKSYLFVQRYGASHLTLQVAWSLAPHLHEPLDRRPFCPCSHPGCTGFALLFQRWLGLKDPADL